jgi:diguanylate cyclase (GGDEF)-like protein
MTETPQLELGDAPLRDYFAARLPDRLREVEEAWEQARVSGWQEAEARTFHRLAHSLTGAGATFGFPAVTEAARRLEQRLKPVAQGATPPPDDATVAQLLDGLRQAGRLPAPAEALAAASEAEVSPEDSAGRKPVLLVENDPETGPWLAQQLERFGYRVRLLEQPDSLAAEIERDPPSALLLNQTLLEERRTWVQDLARLRRSRRGAPKIVFLSDSGDLESRLAAVYAGGAAYFTKPVDVGTLMDQLNLLTGPPAEAYRALVVETDEELADECAGALRAAGLEVWVETDPDRFLEALATSRPDVVLLSLELPCCGGTELAEVLHQLEGYVGTPVLFLAPDGSAEDRLTALELGGDELLTRPIDPLHLIAAVTGRARRGRRLASLISYDGLTSLLNHASLKQQLDAELARAARERVPVAYALLDLDWFKAVNDTGGHAAGDRLLRTLALFLKQRLRRSDIVGRYGGDEIGIIFPNTDGPTAHGVLDQLRDSFSRLRQSFAGTELSATFSGGIAVFPDFPTADLLVEGAEHALQSAKDGGRNRVMSR